jgi:YidC/Oxa1 family membrane protein insertase
LILALTFKSTLGQQKIQLLNPTVQRIQEKYKNQTSQEAKNRMSQEMMELYKREKVNPLSSIIAPFITMPVFVAVYHAVSQTAILKNGSIFGLVLGTTLSNAITRDWNIFAIVLLLLMIGTQFVAMKLPQWLLKKKEKVRFKDPRTKQNNQMQWITYIFLIMIIVMGWMMPTAMTIYWIAGSLVSIGQAFLVNYITKKYIKKEK